MAVCSAHSSILSFLTLFTMALKIVDSLDAEDPPPFKLLKKCIIKILIGGEADADVVWISIIGEFAKFGSKLFKLSIRVLM